MNYGQYVDKTLKLTRKATEEEWFGLNRIDQTVGEKYAIIDYRLISGCHSFQLPNGCWYPCCCFEINEFNYEIY